MYKKIELADQIGNDYKYTLDCHQLINTQRPQSSENMQIDEKRTLY